MTYQQQISIELDIAEKNYTLLVDVSRHLSVLQKQDDKKSATVIVVSLELLKRIVSNIIPIVKPFDNNNVHDCKIMLELFTAYHQLSVNDLSFTTIMLKYSTLLLISRKLLAFYADAYPMIVVK